MTLPVPPKRFVESPVETPFERTQKHIKSLEIKRNRLEAELSTLTSKIRKRDASKRHLRTRCLIQMGGLISLSGLMEICDIEENDDLQQDIEAMNKAATLLGLLLTCVENIRTELPHDALTHFTDKGLRALKRSASHRRQRKV